MPRRPVLRKAERGATVAEFAVVSAFFFMMIFGIIEFGRLLYTHNALTDAARRGARYAALNTENATCVRNVVIYGERSNQIGPRPTCTPIGPALVYGLDSPDVTIDVHYEGVDLDGDPSDPSPIDTNYGMNLGTATVRIQNYTFNLAIPFARRALTLPEYATTLTAESAGTEPDPL
jgi:TadE-like protein